MPTTAFYCSTLQPPAHSNAAASHLCPPGAADARLLRQTTDSFTGTGVDKSWMVLATTDVAESRAQSASQGFEHMEATVTALATDLYPGSQVRALGNAPAPSSDGRLARPHYPPTDRQQAPCDLRQPAGGPRREGLLSCQCQPVRHIQPH